MPKSVYSDAYAVVIDLLVQCRRERGITQVGLAEKLGKPQSFISKIEQRQRRLDLIEFCVIARALNYDPADLFDRMLVKLPKSIEV